MNLTDEELEVIARGATPGPWDHGKASLGDRVGADCDADGWTIIAESPCPRSPQKSSRSRQWHANAAHIAAFNPAQCLALLARLKAAEGENERLRGALSWIEPPLVDEHTSGEELRKRVSFVVADAFRANTGGQHEPL